MTALRPGTAVLLCAAAAAAPVGACAHAFLATASPAVGSTVHAAPSEIRIDFTEAVEPSFSTIAVLDRTGASVVDGKSHLEGGDTHLAVPVKPLAPGRYGVKWSAIAVDTHHTEGSFFFTVAP